MDFDFKTWFMQVWEDNRILTNNIARTLAAAGAWDKQLVAGMRPFRQLMLEIIGIERWNVRGLAHENWEFEDLPKELQTAPANEVMQFSQKVREETRQLWSGIPFEAFIRERPAPAPYIPAGQALGWLTYALENEIHHRGQGFVYLRLLGQEPPAFHIRTE